MKNYYIRIGFKGNTDRSIFENVMPFRTFYEAFNFAQRITDSEGGEIVEIKLRS